ncbi:MAG: phosphoribosylformimino-5-aminoimidazole carboxamide ribotide isomerase [Eubacterium sp.]|nr:phosphoribosylformimino-5-aminoimidazole carboxamide ribotide isomerase [Eubacterium sp.]MCM1213428.1 phosphoribosylformimino-5-aminoimidazole carboxamide ribotide isomerase [Lachnospiraceae bacterium]MCM1305076.1 phosphoribosylformimino-5-aminoimidazole carboxamide ribotide isomerase [Butyrivibrio sp.]MCM1343488.1 phosphoribosylformimino-5-aminoimidazole carboxamide ribotide isomerase [Muribaculaceae bacterium]MCM1240705.1 phosphoribosylformimino-5-aminoimidazole carboxamide ribotide isomer
MEFRPCIDIHNGQVKQIVGGSLRDKGDRAKENFVAQQDAAYYAALYRRSGLKGGHIILLNARDSAYHEASRQQAFSALKAYPGGLQVGGGITPDNAEEYLRAGASHVIVTSYVFQEGRIHYDKLEKMTKAVGKEHLVLDVSCKKTEAGYQVVTDRWQKLTEEKMDGELLDRLSDHCDEFLIHAVDVEGKARGIEQELAAMLGQWGKKPVTYAGGVHSYEDLEQLRRIGNNRLNVTVGSALDLFGGTLEWEKILEICRLQ